jgi:putative ABC transport system permease protein
MRMFGATVTGNGKVFRPFQVTGVWPTALGMNEHVVEYGRMFNELDDEEARSVCVIGTEVRDEIFGSPEQTGTNTIPIGETIFINRQPFTIIGMFQRYESEQEKKNRELEARNPKKEEAGVKRSRGWRGGGRGNFVFWLKNATVYMPLNTMWLKMRSAGGGSRRGSDMATIDPRLTSLEAKIESIDDLAPALQQVHNVLMSTHKGIEDFTFRTLEEWAENIEQFIKNARLSGGMIAGISLLVGGIGIMNIMLASISERVREIGIRKSVGATTSDIFIQILVESLVIAVLGGILGMATSYGLVQLIGSLAPTENTPIIKAEAMMLAFAFSVAVGMLAGLFPAFKASRLDPIQALRYE